MSNGQELIQHSSENNTLSTVKAARIIAELDIKIKYHTLPDANADRNRNNVIGNVVGFLPTLVRMGMLTKKDAQRILREFNNRTGYKVEWDDLWS